MYKLIIVIILIIIFAHVKFFLDYNDDIKINDLHLFTKKEIDVYCKFKNPFISNFYNDLLCEKFCFQNFTEKYSNSKLNVKLIDLDTNKITNIPVYKIKEYINSEKRYLSYSNEDFLIESGLINTLYEVTEIKPNLKTFSFFDIGFGSIGENNKINKCLNSRTFIWVTEGSINIKLIPPCFKDKLDTINNYNELWNNKNLIKNVKLTLEKNQILFVPPFWFYSIQFNENAFVCYFKYDCFGCSTYKIYDNLKTYIQNLIK